MATSSSSPTPGEVAARSTSTDAPVVELAKETAPALTADEQALNEALADQRPPLTDLEGIHFTGLANERHITVEDFAGVGVKANKDLSFTKANGFTVPIGDVNAATVDYLLGDGEFAVVPKDS